MKCPKCKGTDIQFVGKPRKGFSVGKAVVGGLFTGGIGLCAGFIGKDGKKYDCFCNDCGKRFKSK